MMAVTTNSMRRQCRCCSLITVRRDGPAMAAVEMLYLQILYLALSMTAWEERTRSTGMLGFRTSFTDHDAISVIGDTAGNYIYLGGHIGVADAFIDEGRWQEDG